MLVDLECVTMVTLSPPPHGHGVCGHGTDKLLGLGIRQVYTDTKSGTEGSNDITTVSSQ